MSDFYESDISMKSTIDFQMNFEMDFYNFVPIKTVIWKDIFIRDRRQCMLAHCLVVDGALWVSLVDLNMEVKCGRHDQITVHYQIVVFVISKLMHLIESIFFMVHFSAVETKKMLTNERTNERKGFMDDLFFRIMKLFSFVLFID